MKLEQLRDDLNYRYWTGAIHTGAQWRIFMSMNPKIDYLSNLEEVD